MIRRSFMALALASLGGSAMAFLAPVSAYDFDGTLAPQWSTNVHVGNAEYRTGGSPTSLGSPSYINATVGSTNKMVLDVPAVGLVRALHGVGANGGGGYVNLFSIMMDVRFHRTTESWGSLFNTAADNQNDGDTHVHWVTDGFGGPGFYTGGNIGGPLPANDTWTRFVMTFDNSGASSTARYYLDGALVHTATGFGGGLDGRWTLYSWDDNDTDSDSVDILADNDGDKTPAQLSQLAFWGQVLSDQQVADLGGVGSVVPEPASFAILGLGLLALKRRKK